MIILKTLLKGIIAVIVSVPIIALLGVMVVNHWILGLAFCGLCVLGIILKVYEKLFGSGDEGNKKVSRSTNTNKNSEEYEQSSLEFNSGLRESLFLELNKNPQIIKSSTSAITKTICANLGMNDDEAKNKVSRQIDIIKKVYELYKSGFNVQQIILRTKVYENEKLLESEVENILNLFKSIE